MKCTVCFFALFLAPVSAFAQGDFFYSFSDLDSGASNSEAGACYFPGDSGSIFLYYSTENSELDTGAFLEVQTDNEHVINFTAVETFEFDVLVGDTPVGHRWTFDGKPGNGGSFGPGNIDADGQGLTMNAFTVNGGDGIIHQNEGPTFLDAGYDAGAEAFLFARIDFDVIGIGTVNLETSPGSGGIVNDGQTVNPIFGSATIEGIGFVCHLVPEPSSTVVLLFSAPIILRRHRYR